MAQMDDILKETAEDNSVYTEVTAKALLEIRDALLRLDKRVEYLERWRYRGD